MLSCHLAQLPTTRLQHKARWGTVVHARRGGAWPTSPSQASPDEGHPIAKRRRLAFTQQPSQDDSNKQQQQQQQRQQQHEAPRRHRAPRRSPPPAPAELLPDPAADDLDELAAAAAAVGPGSAPAPNSALLLGPVLAIPEGPRPQFLPPSPPPAAPSYRAVDKLRLTAEEAREVAARLRCAGRPPPGQALLRVFRYGIDDLRLFKALEMAGLEGRVVVVDTLAAADALLTTRSKRTGKNVDLSAARRAADAAGVPLFLLRAVSPQRILEALGPLLGLQQAGQQAGAPEQAATAAAGGGGLQLLRDLGTDPRFLRWEETQGDGSEELLQLLWGPAAVRRRQQSSDGVTTEPPDALAAAAAAAGVGGSARWRAWRAWQGCVASELRALVGAEDVEDDRAALVPANPTARAGQRHRLLKPLRHFSRIRRQRLARRLRLQHVSW